MLFVYQDKILPSPDGTPCRVLDVNAVTAEGSLEGRKSSVTLVRCATGGEEIETKNAAGQVESVYRAAAGDAIFINLHNPDDIYVPGTSDGRRWKFAELASKGYEIVGDDQERGGVLVKSSKTFSILHEAILEPTCIENAWGEGQHQFLFKGASLKIDGGRVTGIDKEAFDATWETIPPVSASTSVLPLAPQP